jgi:hypothetical protein
VSCNRKTTLNADLGWTARPRPGQSTTCCCRVRRLISPTSLREHRRCGRERQDGCRAEELEPRHRLSSGGSRRRLDLLQLGKSSDHDVLLRSTLHRKSISHSSNSNPISIGKARRGSGLFLLVSAAFLNPVFGLLQAGSATLKRLFLFG